MFSYSPGHYLCIIYSILIICEWAKSAISILPVISYSFSTRIFYFALFIKGLLANVVLLYATREYRNLLEESSNNYALHVISFVCPVLQLAPVLCGSQFTCPPHDIRPAASIRCVHEVIHLLCSLDSVILLQFLGVFVTRALCFRVNISYVWVLKKQEFLSRDRILIN